jgi:hypothetical protein
MPKVVPRKPPEGSRWISKNGKHKGIEIVVIKVGDTTVVIKPANKNNGGNRILRKPLTWRLPLDAFYRRYEAI